MLIQLSTIDTYNKSRSTTLMQRRQKVLLESPDLTVFEHLETIIKILQKSSRSKLELNFLIKGFQQLNFFKDQRDKLSEASYLSLFKELGYQSFAKEQPIFDYDDYGHTYYIVLKGSVSILLPKEEILLEIQKDNKSVDLLNKRVAMNLSQFLHQNRWIFRKRPEPIKILPYSLKLTSNNLRTPKSNRGSRVPSAMQSPRLATLDDPPLTLSDDEESEHHTKALEKYFSQVYADFTIVRRLQAGDAFGEIALITQSKRTATIVCNEDCDIMTLTKDSFDKILGDQHKRQMNEKIQFFQKFQFLKQVPLGKLMSMIHQMTLVSPKLHEIIYKEADSSTCIYFLLKGEVEISKSVNLGGNFFDRQAQEHSLLQKYYKSLSNLSKNISVSILTEGASFGQEEMITNAPRQSRAVCKSFETLLYRLSKYLFQFLGIIYMHQAENILIKDTQKAEVHRSQRIQKNTYANQTIHNEQRDYISVKRFNELPPQIGTSLHNLKNKTKFKLVQDVQIQEDKKQDIVSKIKTDPNQPNLWQLLTQNQEIIKDIKHQPLQNSTIRHNLDPLLSPKTSSIKTQSIIQRIHAESESFFTNASRFVLETNTEIQQRLLTKKTAKSQALLSSFCMDYDYIQSPKLLYVKKDYLNIIKKTNSVNIHTQRLNPLPKVKRIHSLLTAINHSQNINLI